MLSTYSPSPEQKWQHEAHKARRARMGYAPRKPSPTPEPEQEPSKAVEQYRLVSVSWPDAKGVPPIRRIIEEVAIEHGLTYLDLVGPFRKRHIIEARHKAMWRARKETLKSTTEIARAFNRDHSSVVYAIEKYEHDMSKGKRPGPKSSVTAFKIASAIEMRKKLITWPEIARTLNVSLSGIKTACRDVAKKDPETAALLRRAGRKMLSIGAQKVNEARWAKMEKDEKSSPALGPASLCTVSPCEVPSNKPGCTPPLRRSALNKVETDGRGNIAKRKPIRASIGAISIPDIRINSNGHHA